MGTGGSLAGKEGTTVLCGAGGLGADVELVEEAAGFAAVVLVVVEVVDFAGVVVAAAALGAVVHAARNEEDAKLRDDIRYAKGADLDDDAEIRAEKPLRAEFVAMMSCVNVIGVELNCNKGLQREVTIH